MPAFRLTRSTKILLGYILLVVIVLVLAFIIANFRRRQQPTAPPSSQLPPSVTAPSLPKNAISFTGQFPELPQDLPVYTSDNPISPSSLTSTLTTILHLTQTSRQPAIWQSLDGTGSMTYSTTANQINYTTGLAPLSNLPINPEIAVTTAQEFITSLNLPVTLTPLSDQLTFHTHDGVHLDDSPRESATVIIVPFSQTINNTPIFLSSNPNPLAEVWVDNQNQIVKFTLNPFLTNLKPLSATAPIPQSRIISLLNQGIGQIINLEGGGLLEITSLSNIVLTSTELEYRFHPDTRLLDPYDRFVGTGTADSSRTITLAIIIPAIVTQ